MSPLISKSLFAPEDVGRLPNCPLRLRMLSPIYKSVVPLIAPTTPNEALTVVAVCKFIDVPIMSVSAAVFPTCKSEEVNHIYLAPFNLKPVADTVEL